MQISTCPSPEIMHEELIKTSQRECEKKNYSKKSNHNVKGVKSSPLRRLEVKINYKLYLMSLCKH